VGNGFPGLAIVSVIALLVALGVGTLAIIQPWTTSSVAPQLDVASGLGIGLGDSTAVSTSGGLALAPARPVAGNASEFIAGGLAAGKAEEKGEARLQVGIAPAHVVAVAHPVSLPGGKPGPVAPGATPAPESSPSPAVVPVAAPSPSPAPAAAPPTGVVVERGGGVSGPVGAGAGPMEGEPGSAIEVAEGEEGAFAFSFLTQPTAYRTPGDEDLIVRFAGGVGGNPSFGLQLWDDGSGQRGLWSSGDAMGGERFLAPLADGKLHRVVVDFKASSDGDGFYLVLLDGEPVDARAWVRLIEPGSSSASIEAGLFRDGERVEGASDVLFGPSEFAATLESVLP
jgi:hypothetical protein